MKIRDANNSDKNTVFEFCKNTFSWGDYIQDVWDFWIDEGGLFDPSGAGIGTHKIIYTYQDNNTCSVQGFILITIVIYI